MKVKRIRKKLQDKHWLMNKLEDLMEKSEKWHTFRQFDCSDFFKGPELAAYNRKIWERGSRKTSRQIDFVTKIIMGGLK